MTPLRGRMPRIDWLTTDLPDPDSPTSATVEPGLTRKDAPPRTIGAKRPLATGMGWLGMFSAEIEDKLVVVGISAKGPAARAELKAGDVILAVAGENVSSQTQFYRKLWSLGAAGVDVPLTVYHEGVTFDVVLASTDRAKLLKGPRLH